MKKKHRKQKAQRKINEALEQKNEPNATKDNGLNLIIFMINKTKYKD